MKVLFLTNNEIAIPLWDWLRDVAGEKVVTMKKRLTRAFIADVQPDFTVSYNYRFLISQQHIDALDGKVINIHTSLLPWNRGAAPNLWSFLHGTPKGVTIHEIDAGLDTGRIIVQEECFFDEPSETLSSSYEKLHLAAGRLFKSNWNAIRSQSLPLQPQSKLGSCHTLAEFETVKHLLEPEGWEIPISTLKERFSAFA